MIVTKVQFYTEIYQEHLIETGSIFTHIQDYFVDFNIRWSDTWELQQRIKAHVDALELGEELARKCSLEFLESDDEDEFLGAIYSLATISVDDIGVNAVIDEFADEKDQDRQAYYITAFKPGKHPRLTEKLRPLLQHETSLIRAATAEILGYRGDADPHRIWPLFHDKDESVKTAAMVAVMRLGFKEAVPAMEQAVLENKEIFNEHCIFPLLMLGSQKALQFTRHACQSASDIKPQYPVYLALAGNGEDIAHLFHVFQFDDMRIAALEALGIFGSLHGVNTLMNFLLSKNDEQKLAAAKSLNQISGAQLYETITVIEKDEDDIDPEDIIGLPAASGEGKQPGDERRVEIKQACTDKDSWAQWWQENKANFDQSIRYRYGKPYSFLLCLQEIAHPETNFDDRQRAYHELVIRSGHHIPFEPDWFVDKQIEALKKWQSWWNQNKTDLTNPWMFDGK